jgi:hypothetical protein
MPQDLTPFTPDCGHTVTPTPGSVGTGKATDPKTGRTMCYPCAEAAEREAIKTADTYTGYITDRDRTAFTTWTGAKLGTVIAYSVGSPRYTPTGGQVRMRSVRVRTPDGTLWYGTSGTDMDVITIRRLKNQKG